MTWLTYFITVVGVLILLVVVLFIYYKRQNKRILSTVPLSIEFGLPKLAGGERSFPDWGKMDALFGDEDISKGSILFDVPNIMNTGKKYRIVTKISPSQTLLIKEMESMHIHEILVTDLMSCKLSGEAFTISVINNETQKVFKHDITHWQWDVIPKKGGTQRLLLLASIHVRTGGGTYLKDIPVFERPIVVQINPSYHIKQFFLKNWQWLIGTIIGSGILWEVLKIKMDK